MEINSLGKYDGRPCRGSSGRAARAQRRTSAGLAAGWVMRGRRTEGARWWAFSLNGVDLGHRRTEVIPTQRVKGLSFESSLLSHFKLTGFSQPWTKVIPFHKFSLQTTQALSCQPLAPWGMLDTTDPADCCWPHPQTKASKLGRRLRNRLSTPDPSYSLGKMASKGFPFPNIKESIAK